MLIRVKCPGCGKTIQADSAWAGKTAKCTFCRAEFTFPSPPNGGLVPSRPIPPKPPQDSFDDLDEFIDTLPKHRPIVQSQPVGRRFSQRDVNEFLTTPSPTSELPKVTVEHHHKAAGGAFRTGFGFTFGCLTALAVFTVVGIVSVALLIGAAFKDSGSTVQVPHEELAGKVKPQASPQEPEEPFEPPEPQVPWQDTASSVPAASAEPDLETAPAYEDRHSFSFQNVTIQPDAFTGTSRVFGEVTNRSGKSYTVATFTVSLFNSGGRLIEVGTIAMGSLRNGQTKSFETFVPEVDAGDVDKFKIQFDVGM